MPYVPIRIEISLESPLLVTARQVGLVWETKRYIPGAVIRGGLASVLLPGCNLSESQKLAPEEVLPVHLRECAFHRLFYSDPPPRFGHAYPGITPPIGVLPLTARSCKHKPGFKRDEEDEDRHGVLDILIRQAISEQADVVFKPLCPCGEEVEPFTRRVYTLIGGRYLSPRALTRRLARTAVARERGAVAEGMLYTLEALSEWMDRDELDKDGRPLPAQATFQGVVWVDEAHEGEMREALSQIRHLGAAISRGLGRVKIETWPIQIRMPSEEQLSETAKELAEGAEPERPEGPLPKEADLTERILAFNRLWACEREAKGLPAAGWYFTVDLQSEALLWRANGPAYLLTSDILGFPPEVELVRAFTAHQQIGGWSTAWGMPKPTMPAVAAGSVFLYQVPGDDVALAHKVLKRLTILEKEGVGERREEGYGWLQVCTPFHLEMEVGK